MSLFQSAKPKSAGKIMIPTSQRLSSTVQDTLNHIAQMVGATLGPGGRQVLIERPSVGMKPIITKDGVTVIKHLGYQDAVQQLILEAARDAAGRTATEAGDGTTTATILSAAITDHVNRIIKTTSHISPQKIVRELQSLFPIVEAKILKHKIDTDSEELLSKVATLSGNGDKELAQAVIDAFNMVGDDGNMTIVEQSGASAYKVEKINGYTIETGYEESTRNFANGFINDKSGTMVNLDKPIFLLYDGVINDIVQVLTALNTLSAYAFKQKCTLNIVLVAHGFSDTFVGELHHNWADAASNVKVYPAVSEQNAIRNSGTQFLHDLQAYTGCPVFNPLTKSVADLDPESLVQNSRVKSFEAGRYRSSVIAAEDEIALESRVSELKAALENAESEYEKRVLPVRIGKLTSGIARLNIFGPFQGETREKRDRAEDAWMAIRGAVKHGACPGGGYVLVKVAGELMVESEKEPNYVKKLAMLALSEALKEPVRLIYHNYGFTSYEAESQLAKLLLSDDKTFDVSEQKWVDKTELLDSVPAVVEAIRNSLSIASLLGTAGGIIAFGRDSNEDAKEADFVRRFEGAIGERGSVSGE